MAENEEELRSFLMKLKDESEKVGLKLNIQTTKIMAPGPIISWQIDGETVETVTDFILGGSKITVDGDCSHEIKRYLLWRKHDQPRWHIKKQRHYFANKGPSSQIMAFPVVNYGCENWTIRNWTLKNWCFWTVVLEKALGESLELQDQSSPF